MNTPSIAPQDCTDAASKLVLFFEALSPATLSELERHYAPDAHFKDPFNAVNDVAAIQRIFEHMFATLVQPRFVVTGRVIQGRQCFLTWEFHFGFQSFKRGEKQVILGASHVIFSEQGLVTLHRDYWDAAEELYEKLPWVGALMRWLKRRAHN